MERKGEISEMIITQNEVVSTFQANPGKQVAYKTFHNGNLKVLYVSLFSKLRQWEKGFYPL
ncbi:hypothetical protein ACA29_02970 [Lederbergia galactosidilytica]|uniref:Uncharacterized protein n=1 Tax=Lederbergia galactosidilytica TaxID=217031 RepID=A0A0Q9YAF3_9BACI|nr:hypothetical protein ACA29_02970 [Lederbergia galactosidilytica]